MLLGVPSFSTEMYVLFHPRNILKRPHMELEIETHLLVPVLILKEK